MIVKVSSNVLKQPMEIYIADNEWEEMQAIESQEELNARLTKIALKQVSQHGYTIGYCSERNLEVTLRNCMDCGVKIKGWGKGKDNYESWEECKREHINYKISPYKPLIGGIKDKNLEKKMMPQTKTDKARENNTFSVVEKRTPADKRFDGNSDEFMKTVHEKDKKESEE